MAFFYECDNFYYDYNGQRRGRVDLTLIRMSPVALFWKLDVLEQTLRWLEEYHYRVYRIDCSLSADIDSLTRHIREQIQLEEGPILGLDGFNSDMCDLPIHYDGGVAIVLLHFDHVAELDRAASQDILDILAKVARIKMLYGKVLLPIVQSDDPAIRFDPVGGLKPQWNQQEWFEYKRGLSPPSESLGDAGNPS